MTAKHTLIMDVDESTLRRLEKNILTPAGHAITRTTGSDRIPDGDFDLVFVGDRSGANLLDRIDPLLAAYPASPIILLTQRNRAGALTLQALEKGASACLAVPIRMEEVLAAVSHALARRRLLQRWAARTAGENTDPERALASLRKAAEMGRTAVSLPEKDTLLCFIAEQSAALTGAERSRVLLFGADNQALQLRASFDFEDDAARIREETIDEQEALQAARSDEPLRCDREPGSAPGEGETTGTARLFAPLRVGARSIGVLAVENGSRRTADFDENHAAGLEAFATYAAAAIDRHGQLARATAAHRRTEDMLLAAAGGVILLDDQSRVLRINQAARDMLNLGDRELAGQPVAGLVGDEDLAAILSETEQAKPRRLEYEPGEGRHFVVHTQPIPGAGKTISIQDVSHFKELDLVKSDFVTDISHDLRSPLTAVLGYVELIGRVGETNRQQQEFIQRIQDSVTSITDLIDDLLELGRIEADFDQHKERLPLSVILNYSLDAYRSRFEEKGLTLKAEIQPDLPEIFGSPIRLRQMVGNLLENAHKYTPRGGSVHARLRSENGQVILEVSDTGIGIPEADRPHIFNRLFRASNVSLETPGTGLGLAIVRSIVDNHEGRLWCDSRLGEGSTFTVVLPAGSY